jgi:acetolactate synthase I/II/III large subunit
VHVSDFIAKFLVKKSVDLVFTITGAGSVRLIESVSKQGIKYICPHHEQAAVMASLARMRVTGRPAVCLVTGGPGAANTLIGIANAFLDSMPCIIIAGQEKVEFFESDRGLRGMGIQGLHMVDINESVTKYAAVIYGADQAPAIMQKAFDEAYSERPGPVWIEVPQDVQWDDISDDVLDDCWRNINEDVPEAIDTHRFDFEVGEALKLLKNSERPLLWVGHGVRSAGALDIFYQLVDVLEVPILASWQGADILSDDHELFAGRAGIYGQRWANLALQNCDFLMTLGTRLAIPQRGYKDDEFARSAKKVIVEIDKEELEKFNFKIDVPVRGDVGIFMSDMLKKINEDKILFERKENWIQKIDDWRSRYPMVTESAYSSDSKVNSYAFISKLSNHLNPLDIVVTDMGTALTCTHATIKLKKGQRLITSTGLGEMGFGLPGSIGVALGDQKGNVVLIVGEGSFMMNIQELQTIKGNDLPIKIFLLNNSGYLSIKHTHKALYGDDISGDPTATAPSTGVTFPSFEKIAKVFNFGYSYVNDIGKVDSVISEALASKKAIIVDIDMDCEQELTPKSALKIRKDGSMYSPPLEDLYPFLSEDELREQMIIK